MVKQITSARALSLKDAQNFLRGSDNPFATLSKIRSRISLSDMSAVIAWLPKVRHSGRGVFQGQYPTRNSDLHRQAVMSPVPFDREIIWARHLIGQHATRINSFLSLVRDYERELAIGSFGRCAALLDMIEAKAGISLWTMECRIALLQMAEGLERQKAYVSSIRKSGAQPIVSFIAFYVSHRNEDTATPIRFTKSFAEQLQAWAVPDDLRAYLLFRIANQPANDESAVADILRFEACSAIIDYYDTFIRLGENVFIDGSESVRQRFLMELQKLAPFIDDHRIKKMLIIDGVSDDGVTGLTTCDLDARDALVQGKYKEAGDIAVQSRSTGSLDAGNWLVEAEARSEIDCPIESDDRTLSARIVNLAKSVAAKGDDVNDSIIGLSKFCLNFRLISYAANLAAFLRLELSSDPVKHLPLGVRAFLDHSFLDPAALRYLHTAKQRDEYARLLVRTYGKRPSVFMETFRAGINGHDITAGTGLAVVTPSADLTDEIRIERLLAGEEYAAALTIAQSLGGTSRLRARRAAARYQSYCLLKLGRVEELIDFVVECCLADRGLVYTLPIRECGDHLDKSTRKRLANKLSTPILFDLFSRYIDDKLDNFRSYAYEDFLNANSLEKPSQLTDRVEDFDRQHLIYYLRYICVPAVMQVSTTFGGTRELEEERRAVASLLTRIDPSNSDTYETEIREITRNQIIQRGVRHVEQSKIFVDVHALKRWAERNLKESFHRYQALRKVGIGLEDFAFSEAIQDLLAGVPVPKEFLELPKNEVIDLLLQIVRALLREFALNPEYGLDCYLSIRIRHGTLSGQLRSPLEIEKVITQREREAPKPTNLMIIGWHASGPLTAQLALPSTIAWGVSRTITML